MRFNTFNEVVSWYERTKPVISKNHTKENDVRPIGDRKRKWERIKRIDENTYALCDGNYGNTIWGSNYHPAQDAFENTMAPITWMRREDGDFIRIRNHPVNNCSVTRYNFLQYNLPVRMSFQYNQQGKHWVRYNGEDIALPKCKARLTHTNTSKEMFDDDIYLMFRANEDGTFTRVGDLLKVEVKTIDKELKRQWRERVDAFYTFCAAIAPMVDTTWHARSEYTNMLREHLVATQGGNLSGVWIRSTSTVPAELTREIVATDDHALRVAFATLVISEIGGKRPMQSKDDLRAVRAAYNRLMNRAMGFYKIEEK